MRQPGAQRRQDTVIDENLKRVYGEAIEEGVPDRFRLLLDALRQQEQSKDTQK